MASPEVNINLIGKPKVDFSANFTKWAFNIGKVVIAATELIVLLALAYRFYIDRKIVDLHDKINTEKIYVASQSSKEKNYLSIQNRLANIKTTQKNTNVKVDIMNQILKTVSSGNFSSTNFTIDQNNVNFAGVAFSIFPVNDFINEMKKNPNVVAISLDEFSSTQNGIQFKISMEIKNE